MDREQTPRQALRAAIECYGSQSAMARARKVSQGSVWKWLNEAQRIPAEHVLAVEADTGISRHQLRPDIYPLDLPTSEEVLARRAQQCSCDRATLSHGASA